jgi:hypothetical protein
MNDKPPKPLKPNTRDDGTVPDKKELIFIIAFIFGSLTFIFTMLGLYILAQLCFIPIPVLYYLTTKGE